eukprot:TRINITY_DN23859_c0_g1_i1.p1 TRINITY_DN23859_c0_g1~~TRINITY_DN23859_c0_g1_i1.p1  ORF type:complete len:501 (-),score=47.02 TRINITY_DN23859_c0_g1_i1:184-1686(-)
MQIMSLALKIIALAFLQVSRAEKSEDLVTRLPGFENVSWRFKLYSGFLHVPGPINGYDALRIHYQFHTSQGTPARDPVVAWQQGGPGGSSITIGLYGEMGVFRIGSTENYLNPWAWNRVANMLYLESPAGSHGKARSGFSACIRGGQPVTCHWDDRTQAEAYAHTLSVFFESFLEFATNNFYLTGESYFGQYGPHIAHFILNNDVFKTKINLKGLAAGNACWGTQSGKDTRASCNGPNVVKNDVEFYHGKGLFSTKLYKQIYAHCDFQNTSDLKCSALLDAMHKEVGPHNPYNVYDNCQKTTDFLHRTGKTMDWLLRTLRSGMHNVAETHAKLKQINGGFEWDCLGDADEWITRDDVKKALHLDGVQPRASKFEYNTTGPGSVTLYPELIQKIRILIYNGDADPCVPFIGNEEWIEDFENRNLLSEKKAWTPWYTSNRVAPAGYVTEYDVIASSQDFSFVTIRLAGHMVPQYQPEAAFTLFSSFVTGKSLLEAEHVVAFV